MLHVVTGANQHLYGAQLQEMLRQRKAEFVGRQGWELQVFDGLEKDDGDDERAVYLLALNATGECRSSIRIRPADDFSYMIDRMPEFIDGDAQALRNDPALWEIARWINHGGWKTGQEIRIGLIEYLHSRGVTQAISCADVEKADYAIRTGWRLRYLGQPRRYAVGGRLAVAVSLTVSAEEVEQLRARFGRRDMVLIEVPADAPWAGLPLPVIEREFRVAADTASSTAELHEIADTRLRRSRGV
ncbi:MAG TPA: acyl-homoserine-lactone synthase [Longimicrobium sp.]|nr:acyl-homoserine-lactone synthase [Longimicrobium sp.]